MVNSRDQKLSGTYLNRRHLLARGTVGLVGAGITRASKHAGTDKNDHERKGLVNRIDNVANTNTDSGPVNVVIPGTIGPKRRVCGWPNLIEITDLALKHFNKFCDPNYRYVPYISGILG